MERVVEQLGLQANPDFLYIPEDERDAWEGASISEAALALQLRLGVRQFSNSRIVSLTVQDRNPERAMLLVNSIMEAYVEKTLEDRLGTTVEAFEWLSVRLANLRSQLEASEDALVAFKDEHGVLTVSLADQQNSVSRRLAQWETGLRDIQSSRIALQARLNQLRQSNRDDPMEVHSSLLSNDIRITALRTSFLATLSEIEASSVRYGPQHPEILALEQRLQSIRDGLRAAVNDRIASLEGELREVMQTESGLSKQIADALEEGQRITQLETEYQRLNRERENNADIYDVLLKRTVETELNRQHSVAHARVVDQALKPEEPVSPLMLVASALGVAGGLLLGVLLAITRARMDRRIRSVESVESLGLTVLGVLPKIEQRSGFRNAAYLARRKHRDLDPPIDPNERELLVHKNPKSAAAECARSIRTNISFMSVQQQIKTILVTSPLPQEGKTTVAVTLAITMAQSGKRVLLVDTDLRRPRIHRLFGGRATVGMTSLLLRAAKLEEATKKTDIQNLDVLPCGPIPPNPAELLHTSRFRTLMNEMSVVYDLIVFDSPPLRAVTDAAIMATQVDGTVMVLRSDSTYRDALKFSLRQLDDVSAPILGGVVNDVVVTDRSYKGGGYYRYAYYSSDDNGVDSVRDAAE
ncbi:MAG: polysaccharide biosynthesis tyrosine autokinase, partial [Myxococcota bacterium]